MCLRDILTKISDEKTPILLNDGEKDWEARVLLESLSEPRLRQSAHMQAGLYIAEVDEKGYMGRVLYKIREAVS